MGLQQIIIFLHTNQHFLLTTVFQIFGLFTLLYPALSFTQQANIKTNVICTESTMRVEVERSSLCGLDENYLQLRDPTNNDCSLHSNTTHVIAVIRLSTCGTQIEEDDENLIFKNEITTVDNSFPPIRRKPHLEVHFSCQYPKGGNVIKAFMTHRESVTVWERGFGTFTYQFEFYRDEKFKDMIDPISFPLECDIGHRIYMKIEATSSIKDIVLFVESCRATPYDIPNSNTTYSIIENGCETDQTVKIYSNTRGKQFKFSMEAFQFIGNQEQVYIRCSVLMCKAGNPETRCSQGCINHPRSDSHHHQKREVAMQSANHFVSQGPLRLRRSAESIRSTVNNLNLNLVFVTGCLLVVLGMVCGVAMHKAKMSKIKYQSLSAFQS